MVRVYVLIVFFLFLSCEVQDFLYSSRACSIDKIKQIVEKDSVTVQGKVFFYGDTIRTDTVNLLCKEEEILSVSRKMNAYHTVADSTESGIDLINIKKTAYKVFVLTERKGIAQTQSIYAEAVLPKGGVGYTLSNSGEVYSRNPFLRNKKVVTTDMLPKSEVQRIHNTAKGMKKETSYPNSPKDLKQYTGNGLYYIGEKDGMVWGVWIIGNVVPPKGDIS